MGLFDKFKKKIDKEYSKNKQIRYIQKNYYDDYPEFPYISKNRNFEQWIGTSQMFPPTLVDREMMVRNENGLLNGHIFMIYWIDKYQEDRAVPFYFEYKYGLDFPKEKEMLENQGYIINGNATDKGKEFIEKYKKVIDDHIQDSKGIIKVDMEKELAAYKEHLDYLKSVGIKPTQTLEQRKGFLLQTRGINHYKNKEYDEAESYLHQALDHDYYSPGGVEYLAKIYRKRKEYENEVDILDRSIERLIDDLPEEVKNSDEVLFGKLKTRRNKAQLLLEKSLEK